MAPVLATSMLLNVREVDNECTREIVSALIFAPINGRVGSDFRATAGLISVEQAVGMEQ